MLNTTADPFILGESSLNSLFNLSIRLSAVKPNIREEVITRGILMPFAINVFSLLRVLN